MSWENITLDCNTLQFADATDQWWRELNARYYPLSDASKFTGDFIFTSQYLDPQPASFSEWLFGDEQAGVKMVVTTTSWSLATFEIYNNGVKLGDSGLDEYLYAADREYKYNNDKISFGIACGVDRATGKGTIYAVIKQDNNNYHRFVVVWLFNLNDYNRGVDNSTIYEILTDNEYHAHTWKPVASVSGKNGKFDFTMLYEQDINNGDPVHNAGVDVLERISEQTKVATLAQNLGDQVETPIIYAGKVDFMSIEAGFLPLITSYTLSFYLSDTTTPFYVINNVLPDVYLSFIIDEENQVARPSLIHVTQRNPFTCDYNIELPTTAQQATLYTWLKAHSEIPSETEDDPDGNTLPLIPDTIAGLSKPSASAIDTGFTTLYRVDPTVLKSLATYLWSDNFWDNINKFFDDPREIVVGVSIMPVDPEVGSQVHIEAGGIDTGVMGYPLTSQYVLLDDFGSITIPKSKGNFLDYPPFTKVIAHLPFVGEHPLDVNDIMGKTLTLEYIFDFLSGSCVACIKVDGSAHYFFGGSCGIQVPISSEDYGRQYSSILSAGATIGSALATVATGGLTAPLLIGAGANSIANGMNMSPDVSYTSGNGSINGMLSSQGAYITIETPREKLASNQSSFIGRTSFINSKLENCSGFTKCYKVHLDGLNCTTEEYNEIMSALLEGVRIETGSTLPDVTPTTQGDTVILFLKMSSESDVIGKTFDTEHYTKLEGKLLYDQSILSPKFVISGDVTGYNYAYIPDFNRFYYITDIVLNQNTVQTVSFKVDALESWKSGILNCNAILERQESKISSQLNDGQYWTEVHKDVTPIYFKKGGKNSVFARENNVFILTIAGATNV